MNRNIRMAALAAVLALVALVYSNHYGNAFHFDDFHTIVNNPWIRDLGNVPRFFTDVETSSVLPANQTYRPLITTSLAVDYRLGKGLQPFYFHVSTMFWFLVQLALMFLLFRKALEGAGNEWVALFATAVYGVHPAMAETVNYVIQRADLYSTLGVIAGLVAWGYFPARRRQGLYLAPVAAAVLSKQPAMIFPALLFLYVWLVEGERPRVALRSVAPSAVLVGALGWLSSAMVPKSFTPGAFDAYGFRISQPAVLLHHFREFFVPDGLTADTDRVPFTSLFQDEALAGFAFLAALIGVALWCARRGETKREWRPVAFGLLWFVVAAAPTCLFAVAEVENDHRMFFPFVGLTLAVCQSAAILARRMRVQTKLAGAAGLAVLLLFARGTRERNVVWHTEESLWQDVTVKSPRNGRGLMNYGLTLMARGDTARALDYFQRALEFNPNYYVLEVNLGVANGALHNDAEAEKHFARAMQLEPNEAVSHYFYAVWLKGKGRMGEAIQQLNTSIAVNPAYIDAPHLLMDTYAEQGDAEAVRRTANETLARFPADAAAQGWLARAASIRPASAAGVPAAPVIQTPENWLNQSLAFYRQGRYDDCIRAAREALKLRPDYSDAWNNIAAAYNSERKWDEGIAAAETAVRLKPDNQLAKNNLAWAIEQRAKSAKPPR